MTATFVAKKLVLARESRGKSQKELSSDVQLSQGQLSKFESGIAAPSEEQLQRIARALSFPAEFFTTTDPFEDLAGGVTFYRRRQRISMRNLRVIQARVALIAIQISRLLGAVDIEVENRFHKRSISEVKGGPQEIARLVRADWKLPAGPVANVTAIIEAAGGIVVPCDFLGNQIDALYQTIPNLPPLFFINTQRPGDRVRLSLAHEVGHAIMHDEFTDTVEDEAYAFAAELLLPKADIASYLTDFTLAKAAQLKPFWKVSMAALIVRAHDLAKISDRHYSTLFMQLSANGYRTREPAALDVPVEQPTVLSDLIRTYREQLGYDIDDLCKLLTIHEADLYLQYLHVRHPLRIVS